MPSYFEVAIFVLQRGHFYGPVLPGVFRISAKKKPDQIILLILSILSKKEAR
jgi:hypothetical protein